MDDNPVFDRIRGDVEENDVVLFMKGTPVLPQCGFSAATVHALTLLGVKFKGIWAQNEEFPGRVAKLPDDRDWSAQLELWRKQLETLIAEYATGDTRILLDDLDQAKGPFAPLTRIIEQLTLARGWLDERSAP